MSFKLGFLFVTLSLISCALCDNGPYGQYFYSPYYTTNDCTGPIPSVHVYTFGGNSWGCSNNAASSCMESFIGYNPFLVGDDQTCQNNTWSYNATTGLLDIYSVTYNYKTNATSILVTSRPFGKCYASTIFTGCSHIYSLTPIPPNNTVVVTNTVYENVTVTDYVNVCKSAGFSLTSLAALFLSIGTFVVSQLF
eukprot:TRINITY_DN5886_c0_g1_i4.p1 TRINITY_DN5886_c0_g1~~TRINITY_DN5886_c0_g1_i4.p1  ORF type:complete len:194 (-),score=30.62 TRINITY_DN5886_c0_g1_i4:97-678(-)